MSKNKIAIAFSVFLMLAMIASLVSLPPVKAHDPPWSLPTYAFINVTPNPIGVGQMVYVNFWLNVPPPTASGAYGDRWHGLTIKVVDPDGHETTLGPFTSDDTGGTHTTFTPDKVGDWTFQCVYTGETLLGENTAGGGTSTNAYVGDYYEPSESIVYHLVVQDEPISNAPVIPLPTEYWTRPIYAQNNDLWAAIGGNWLGLQPSTFANTGQYNSHGDYAPYTTAPNSPHVMWTRQIAYGGTMGGEFGSDQQSNYWSTSQYQPKFAPIIIHGVLYYTMYPGSSANVAGWRAVNLHTGEIIWEKDTQNVLRCGQIMNFLSPNEYGGRAYLWATGSSDYFAESTTGVSYSMYDAMTGDYILTIVNGSSFNKLLLDDHGGLIGYYVRSNSINVWNSTRTILRGVSGTGDLNNAWQWRPTQDGIYSFENGIEWSAPVATEIDGNSIRLSIVGVDEESETVLMSYYSGQSAYFQGGWYVYAAYSSVDGHLLWGPINQTKVVNSRLLVAAETMGNGVWVEFDSAELTATGFSLATGNKVWGPTPMPNCNPYSSLGQRYCPGPDGALLTWTYGGDAYSIDMATGTFNWEYHSPSAGYESPYGIWPFWTFSVGTVADGKLFIPVGHMYSPPLFHHAQQMALNLTDGSVVWSITAFDVTSAPAISDGVMVTLNAYDNQLYAWGKGPTQMTVDAPSVGATTAAPVTIRGTIMDVSAGSEQEAQAARFPNGLPCVSEESQQAWMEYVYMQQPRPTNTTGVEVTISVLDPNNNSYDVATATSDDYGFYSAVFTPPVPGSYKVYATFEGSESYYGAVAVTSVNVGEAATTASEPTPQSGSVADLYFLPVSVGIIVVIAVIGLVIILMLRKR